MLFAMTFIPAQTVIPSDFGSGGAYLCPGGGAGSPDLKTVLANLQAADAALDASLSVRTGFVLKETAESRANTTVLALDSALKFVGKAGERYSFTAQFIVIGNTTTRFQLGVAAPAGSIGCIDCVDIVSGGFDILPAGGAGMDTTAFNASLGAIAGPGINLSCQLRGICLLAADGTIGLSWAQSVSGSTPATVIAGSTLRYMKIN